MNNFDIWIELLEWKPRVYSLSILRINKKKTIKKENFNCKSTKWYIVKEYPTNYAFFTPVELHDWNNVYKWVINGEYFFILKQLLFSIFCYVYRTSSHYIIFSCPQTWLLLFAFREYLFRCFKSIRGFPRSILGFHD